MIEPFDIQRFNIHILPTIHQCINELSVKLKSVALRLKKGKRQRRNEKIARLHDQSASTKSTADENEMNLIDNNENLDDDYLSVKNQGNDDPLLMANCVSYRQLIISILRLISYTYRSSNDHVSAYENVSLIMKNETIDFLLLKTISVPLIDQLFNLYHQFGSKFLFISRRKKVSLDMRVVMSHSTIAMNFLFKLIFEISPCALITVLFSYIQNDDYAKTCCSILRDHLIPCVTKCSRLRHEQLVYEMQLRQMIVDKDYMQIFDILRVDIERVIYRKFPLPFNISSCLKSLYISKFHMYKRNTKHIYYYESDEAVQLVSKKITNATLIVFIKGMCVFVFDVIELNGDNLEEKSWCERLEMYKPYRNDHCQEIIQVTEIHETELDALIQRPTFLYVKTCGFGLGTFFETFHKYEKKGRRIPMTNKLPRDNTSFLLHDNMDRVTEQMKKKNSSVDGDYDVIDQL